MKKSMVMAAVAALVLAGCSQDNGLENDAVVNNSKAIEFRTVTDKTKTTEMDKDNIGDFRVSAINDEAGTTFDFMNDVAVIKTGTAWSYAPIKYFPEADLDFYAYSPSGSVNVSAFETAAGAATATITYTVPLSSEGTKKPEDFLVAATQVANGTYTAVSMNFKHALSLATFAAKNTSEGATFTVKAVKLKTLTNTGTLTATAAVDPTAAVFAWAPETTTSDYSASLPGAGVSILPGGTTATAQNLTSTNEGLMILPQTTTTSSKLEITFGAVDGSNTTIYPQTTTKEFDLPTSFVFEMGKKYLFSFTFDALNDITFSVDVTPWNTDTPIEL